MITEWQNFLIQQHAIFKDGLSISFSNTTHSAVQDSTALCSLDQFGTLRISGDDAPQFLQNLLSNDIREVSNTQAQLSSFNTAKGRMLATFLIWHDADGYLLQMPHTLTEAIRKKLSMYVLRSKVKISDASEEIVTLGLSGEKASEALQKLDIEALPQQIFDISYIQKLSASVIKLGESRFQINTTQQNAQAIWQQLALDAHTVGCAHWDWLNIRAGFPTIQTETQEQFVPQMVNFELIGGINFKKGCYPGQEIVARMHYLGKPKRRMYLAHVAGDTIPAAGNELYSADMSTPEQTQPCGMIANVAASPSGGYDILAVVQITSRETNPTHLNSLAGAKLEFLELPYSLP